MKLFFHTSIHPGGADLSLLLLRLIASGSMLTHGIPKLKTLLAGSEIRFADPVGIGEAASSYVTVFGEFVRPLFIIMGLRKLLATIPLAIVMAVATFIVLAAYPFADKELAFLCLLMAIICIIFRSGRISIDHLLFGRKK